MGAFKSASVALEWRASRLTVDGLLGSPVTHFVSWGLQEESGSKRTWWRGLYERQPGCVSHWGVRGKAKGNNGPVVMRASTMVNLSLRTLASGAS